MSVYKTLQNYPSSWQLRQILKCPEYSDLVGVLDGPGPLTLFCPVNSAIQEAQTQMKMFGADPKMFLRDILLCHVAKKEVKSSDAPCFVENACSDPDWVNLGKGKGQLMKLVKDKCGLSIIFGIPGWPMWTARVWQADIQCANGSIWFVSKLMRFPYTSSVMMRLQGLGISFRYAIESSNLSTITNSTTNITIFVPRNGKFDDVINQPQGMGPNVMDDLIKCHHVKGRYTSLDLKDGMTLKTLNDHVLKVTVKGGNVFLNGVMVTTVDILAKNAVIHILDGVVQPMREDKREVGELEQGVADL